MALFLTGYVAHEAISIARSSEDPPVRISSSKWQRGAGKWAICGTNRSSWNLVGAGVGLLSRSPPNFWNRDTERTGFRLPTPQLTHGIRGELLNDFGHFNCTIVDLTDWQLPEERPSVFFLCAEAARPSYFVWSENHWEFVHYHSPKEYAWFRLEQTISGWNFGYADESWEVNHVTKRFSYTAVRDNSDCCREMSWFDKSEGAVSAIEISIEQKMRSEVYMQGVFPQLYRLCGTLGGCMSLLVMIYSVIFVKKYPDSLVSQTYDARTFVGEKLGRARLEQDDAPIDAPISMDRE